LSRASGHLPRAREAEAKSRAYDLLALGFGEPRPELAEAVGRPGSPFSLPVPDPEELVSEYHRLFVGPDHLPAPPYESVYRDGGTVMGESTLDVVRQYRQAGYALDPRARELPDHVGSELAFMALLSAEEAAAWEEGDPARAERWRLRQRDFLDGHLALWAPELSSRVLEATDAPFYRGLAVSLRECVAVELERLAGGDQDPARE